MIWSKKEIDDLCEDRIKKSMDTLAVNLKVQIEDYWDRRMQVVSQYEKTLEEKGNSMQAKVDSLAASFSQLAEITVSSSKSDEALQARLAKAESQRLEMAVKASKSGDDWRADTMKHMEIMETHAESQAKSMEQIAEVLLGFKTTLDQVGVSFGELAGSIDDLRKSKEPKKKVTRG